MPLAADLRRKEIARLSDAIEALRVMTPPQLRNQIALMLERFGQSRNTFTK
jgi:hypothetical protein